MLRSWLFKWKISQTNDDRTMLLRGLHYLDYTVCIAPIVRPCSLKIELVSIYVTIEAASRVQNESKENLAMA